MIGAAVFLGTIWGFRKANKEPCLPFKSFPVVRTWLAMFVFYCGSLNILPFFLANHPNGSVEYAIMTVVLWLIAILLSTVAMKGFFLTLNGIVRWYVKKIRNPDTNCR